MLLLLTWSTAGLLTGKYSKDHIPEGSRFALEKYKGIKESSVVDHKLEQVDKLKAIADEIGATLPQLAIAWAAKNPNVSVVLLGATKEAQVSCLCCPRLWALAFPICRYSPQGLVGMNGHWQYEGHDWLKAIEPHCRSAQDSKALSRRGPIHHSA